LSVELLEVAQRDNLSQLKEKVLLHLEDLKTKRPEVKHLIEFGIELILDASKA